jgi:DNA-binding HxlR family transcriptional regulator
MMREDEAEKVLAESPEDIAGLLKSVANVSRVEILALLLRGNATFAQIMARTRLSKTALANHLVHLADRNLVERKGRGEYALTADGRDLIRSAASAFDRATARSVERTDQLRKHYRRAMEMNNVKDGALISRPATYQGCWLSYTGAMAGCLKALGKRCDPTDVGGHSGYAFMVNVSKGETCPSGPTAMTVKVFKDMVKSTEGLGWAVEPWIHSKSYPSKPGSPTAADMEVVRGLFEDVKREILDNDRPVVLWGLVVPEYGIVNGYEGTAYRVSTVRTINDLTEDPVQYYDLNAPGCIDALYFRKEVEVDSEKALEQALRRALRMAKGDVPIQAHYVAGPPAFEEWATVLTDLPPEKRNYLGNSYTGACVGEGRRMSAEFLKRAARDVDKDRAKDLMAASRSYSEGADLMGGFMKLFPFAFEGTITDKDAEKGAVILREARKAEEKAVAALERAV